MAKDLAAEFIDYSKSKRQTIGEVPLYPMDIKFQDGTQGINMGLSKREYFAAMAMQGYLSGEKYKQCSRYEICAKAAMAADALIEALNK
jgi:hypothetical protein